MNKISPLFEAINEIDDNIVSEVIETKKRALGMKAVLIAAAITVTAVLAGFTYAVIPGVHIGGTHAFDYNISVQEGMLLPSKDEMLEWGAAEYGDFSNGMYIFKKNTTASDLFRKFNIHPLISDNFTEDISEVLVNACLHDLNGESAPNINFAYTLDHKQSDLRVNFTITCYYEESELFSYHSDNDRYEIIKLNDGSKALINDYEWGEGIQSSADFSYGGIVYHLYADTDTEGMKQILSDLKIL